MTDSQIFSSTSTITIGRYKLLKELGRGAMSVVYQAEDPDIGRSLAIKLLKHELVEKEEYRQLFLREAKAAGRLSHPGIVTIYDVGIWQNRPFIAMELLEGQTLEHYLNEHQTFGLESSIDFAKQMIQALQYAHQNGVIHRDLKPDNILVLDEGKRFKITDFGIAHLEQHFLDESLNEKDNEQDKKVMGTPAYMSPEQITGVASDFKTDLYSLGVILYQITKGELPFKAKNYAEVMKAVLQQNPKPLNNYSDQAIMWQSIIFRLLQKNPDNRYSSSEELLSELDVIAKELAQEKQGLSRLRFVSMRARWAIILSSLVFVVMVIGMSWVYYKQNQLMNQLAFDYGRTMSQIISKDTAESLLLDEQLALQAITSDIAQSSDILYLSIRNNDDLVLSSSRQEELSKPFKLNDGNEFEQALEETRIYSNQDAYDRDVLFFDSPIKFQDKKIGTAHIAISRENLNSATRSSLMTMIIWMLFIILAVFTGIYWLANRFSQRINKARQAIRDIKTHGQADILTIDSNDEVGRLQSEVNDLSKKLSGVTETQKLTMVMDASDLHTITDLDKTIVLESFSSHSEKGLPENESSRTESESELRSESEPATNKDKQD